MHACMILAGMQRGTNLKQAARRCQGSAGLGCTLAARYADYKMPNRIKVLDSKALLLAHRALRLGVRQASASWAASWPRQGHRVPRSTKSMRCRRHFNLQHQDFWDAVAAVLLSFFSMQLQGLHTCHLSRMEGPLQRTCSLCMTFPSRFHAFPTLLYLQASDQARTACLQA